jgi:hypothetical protein
MCRAAKWTDVDNFKHKYFALSLSSVDCFFDVYMSLETIAT